MVYNNIEKLANILERRSAQNIFLVTGKKSFIKSGAKKIINPIISKYQVAHFFDFEPNPKIEDLNRGIKKFKNKNIDTVIAVGGGSVIDMAKLVNFFSAQSFSPLRYLQDGATNIERPQGLIAIPTTAGTGSEATRFVVLYINKKKYSVVHEYIVPGTSILDSRLLQSLSPQIIASTSMDALAQSIEAYWSVNSTDISKKYAREAIRLIVNNLIQTIGRPTKASMKAMLRAAYLSGKAIDISKTTACHAVSYPITSYFGVPHGHAVALTLPSMLEYNSKLTSNELLDKRGVRYVKQTIREICELLGTRDVADAKECLNKLMGDIGLAIQLRDFSIKKTDLDIIIKNGFNPERVKNNPRKLTKPALRKMLVNIY